MGGKESPSARRRRQLVISFHKIAFSIFMFCVAVALGVGWQSNRTPHPDPSHKSGAHAVAISPSKNGHLRRKIYFCISAPYVATRLRLLLSLRGFFFSFVILCASSSFPSFSSFVFFFPNFFLSCRFHTPVTQGEIIFTGSFPTFQCRRDEYTPSTPLSRLLDRDVFVCCLHQNSKQSPPGGPRHVTRKSPRNFFPFPKETKKKEHPDSSA